MPAFAFGPGAPAKCELLAGPYLGGNVGRPVEASADSGPDTEVCADRGLAAGFAAPCLPTEVRLGDGALEKAMYPGGIRSAQEPDGRPAIIL